MKSRKRIGAILIVLALCAALLPTPAFADSDDCRYILYEGSSERGQGYAVRSDGTVFMITPMFTDEPELHILDANGTEHRLQRQFWIGEIFAFYTVGGSSSALSTFDVACPKKGDSVEVLYAVSSGGGSSFRTGSGRIGEVARDYEDGTVQLRLIPDGALNYEEHTSVPLMAFQDGVCIGVVSNVNNGWQVYVDWFDPATFDGGSSEPAPSPTPTTNISLTPTEPPATDEPAQTEQPDDGESLDKPVKQGGSVVKTVVAVVLGLLAAAGGTLLVILAKKRKAQAPQEISQEYGYGGDYTPPSYDYPETDPGVYPVGDPGVYTPPEPAPNSAYTPYPGNAPAQTPWTAPQNYTPQQQTPAAPVAQQPSAPRSLYLACTGGILSGNVYPIGAVVKIGRAVNNNIKYPEDYPGVSREHATLHLTEKGLFLVDTSSMGTYLRRPGSGDGTVVRAPAKTPVPLQPGDVIYLAEEKNRFQVISR